MPRLGNILSDSDEITIPTSDGDIHIQYYPSRVTQKMINQFRSLGKGSGSYTEEEFQEATKKAYTMLLHIVKSWDLEDDVPCGKCEICKTNEGKEDDEVEECQSKEIVPFPLVAERMDDLPAWLLEEVGKAIMTSPNRTAPQRKRN